MFPSPSSGIIELNVHVKPGQTYDYEILNSIGEKIVTATGITSANNHHTIDLSQHASGIYFVKITSGAQTELKKFSLVK